MHRGGSAPALVAAAVLGLMGVAPSPTPSPAHAMGVAPASPHPSASASAENDAAMSLNGYVIETDTTNWNANSGDFTMPHEVRVTRSGSDARGDKASGNSKRGVATLIGNVVVHDDGGAPEAKDVGGDYSGTATITCDQLAVETKQRIYDAQGNVRFSQGNRHGSADRGTLNQTAHTLHLEGKVVLVEGDTSIRASVVDYNLQSKDVTAVGAPMIIRQPVPSPSPKPSASARPS
jgi:lipopolysaccharide export system protein LptA